MTSTDVRTPPDWSHGLEPPTAPVHAPGPGARLWRGRPDDPSWVRPALLALLGSTALLYLWDLGASGWGNTFYSAAVQAGSHSWKAFFFGSSDAANLITVDKPPASLWVMDLAARVFGVNAWSILVPQALEGVAAVAVLYATVRRWSGPAAGLIAGAVLALTPAAVLMFRFNNPDAMLTLLLTLAAYATTRALEKASTRWLLAAGAFVGFAFLAKSMQAFLVLPAVALAYLVAAPTSWRRRIGQLLGAGAATVVTGGWWVAVVSLWPASSRPYIGGSQHNSVIELILGYNGFGRLTGNETGSVVPGGNPGAGMWGATGWDRLFTTEYGGQVAWLIPGALVLLAGVLVLTLRRPNSDRLRAAAIIWGGWLVGSGLVISYAKGIIHPYYVIALAPAIGGLVGVGGTALWAVRDRTWARLVLAGAMLVTTVWAGVLLNRSASWHPWLRPTVVAAGVAATLALLVSHSLTRRVAILAALVAVVVGLAGPAAYALETARTPHSGAIPSAGPAVAGGRGAPGGRFAAAGPAGTPGRVTGGPQAGAGGGGAGGLLDGSSPTAELTTLLSTDAVSYTWVAAAVGANSAAGYQLATGLPVMSLGGFNGSDPYPTLAQFQADVAAHKVHYFIGGGGGFGGRGGLGGSGTTSAISEWVAATFTPQTVGGVTVYDLTSAATSSSSDSSIASA
jgi:4-amino-4-deoxy-L-arabinose transferase-like glycosyltransferase